MTSAKKARTGISGPIWLIASAGLPFLLLFGQDGILGSPILFFIVGLVGPFFIVSFIIRKNAWLGIFCLLSQAYLLVYAFAQKYIAMKLLVTVSGKEWAPDRGTSFFFSVVTWTTLGYGDLAPSNASRPFAMAEAILGQIYMGVFAALVFEMIRRMVDREKRRS